MTSINFSVIILAAGQGKRMLSTLPKVLHPVGGQPMLVSVVQMARKLSPKKIIAVVPENDTLISEILTQYNIKDTVQKVVQNPPRGTGDAVRVALQVLTDEATVLVLNGDMPLISDETIQRLQAEHQEGGHAITLLSVVRDDSFGFGRVLRDHTGRVRRIVEERDATPEEKSISEFNVGVYIFSRDVLEKEITHLNSNNSQGEFYLTDVISRVTSSGGNVGAVVLDDERESLGANTFGELSILENAFHTLRRAALRAQGVFIQGEDVFIDASVEVAAGVRIESPCYLRGKTKVAGGAVLKSGVYADDAVLAAGVSVGPFVHLRPGTLLSENVKVGNFVEIKKSTLGKGAKAGHLSYLGDAIIGENTNIGAGTITCNYDGEKKFQTIIEDGAFIGSDTQLVAPVKVGKGAYVGAGTTVTKDVPDGALAISRVHQRDIQDWATRKKSVKKGSS